MKRKHGRIKIEKRQVLHSSTSRSEWIKEHGYAHTCMFGCGERARHRVKIGNARKIYCCTPHFAQIFELPATRHAKSQKVKAVRPAPSVAQDWTLKRTLDFPLHFFGERLSCFYDGSVAGMEIFFSIYKTMATTEEPRQFLSLAVIRSIDGQTHSLNFVCEYTDTHIYIAIHEVIVQYTTALGLDEKERRDTTVMLKSIGSKFMAHLDKQVRK